MEKLFEKLKEEFPDSIKDVFPWPEPYCRNLKKVKAIVLGADPSYYPKYGEIFKSFQFVFEMEMYDKRESNPYFDKILNNLELIGLDLDTIYVENVCRNYFTKTTYEHSKAWKEAAKVWIPHLKDELDRKFPDMNIPVLMTTEIIYESLLDEQSDKLDAVALYENPKLVPIAAENNALARPLIPLYRHPQYTLKDAKWEVYRTMVAEYLNKEKK
ncbi:hypothetical protein F9K33_14525 [bacterium]|nr:MAG: hypothetical protein F9K33_14525 [bacterium]